MRKFVLGLLATLSVGYSASTLAALNSIDFSGPSVGDIVTNQFPGVSISLVGGPPIAGPRIYLLEDTSGNPVNVLGATGNAITPGDNVGGINAPFYDIEFSFPSPIDYFSIQVLDAEEAVRGNAYLGGQLLQSVLQGQFLGLHSFSVFNGPVYRIELGAVGGAVLFDRVVIDLTENDGPELFDNVSFNTLAIPEPSSVLFLLWALTALCLMKSARHSATRRRILARSMKKEVTYNPVAERASAFSRPTESKVEFSNHAKYQRRACSSVG